MGLYNSIQISELLFIVVVTWTIYVFLSLIHFIFEMECGTKWETKFKKPATVFNMC